MPYYAETYGFDGKTRSVLFHQEPPVKRPEGGKIRYHLEPVKIKRDHAGYPLDVLRRIYGQAAASESTDQPEPMESE